MNQSCDTTHSLHDTWKLNASATKGTLIHFIWGSCSNRVFGSQVVLLLLLLLLEVTAAAVQQKLNSFSLHTEAKNGHACNYFVISRSQVNCLGIWRKLALLSWDNEPVITTVLRQCLSEFKNAVSVHMSGIKDEYVESRGAD